MKFQIQFQLIVRVTLNFKPNFIRLKLLINWRFWCPFTSLLLFIVTNFYNHERVNLHLKITMHPFPCHLHLNHGFKESRERKRRTGFRGKLLKLTFTRVQSSHVSLSTQTLQNNHFKIDEYSMGPNSTKIFYCSAKKKIKLKYFIWKVLLLLDLLGVWFLGSSEGW